MKYAQTRSRKLQEQILAAAHSLLLSQGFEATTVADIAKKAGISKASVFAHFGDKSNLLIAVGIEEMRALNRKPAETLQEFYTPWFEFLVKYPDFSKLFLDQSSLSHGPWSERFIDSCRAQEEAVIAIIGRQTPHKDGTFLARGAQAFFYQAVIYKNAGWIKTNRDALNTLDAQLQNWMGAC